MLLIKIENFSAFTHPVWCLERDLLFKTESAMNAMNNNLFFHSSAYLLEQTVDSRTNERFKPINF